MSRRMNRRIFLRGLGGAVVAAPFLSSLGGSFGRASAQAVTPPKRLIVMFTHYGCITNRFFPAKSHGELSAAALETTTLAPLAPFAKKLLIPRGIRAMNEWTQDLSRGQGNDPHGQVVGSYFTCQPLTPNSDDPFRFPQTHFQPKPVGVSLDHVMARQLSPKQEPLLIRVGNANNDVMSSISWSAPETRYPGLGNPTQIFSAFTGVFDGGSAMTPDTYQAVRGKSLVDLVADDLSTLERFDMSQSDKLKLAAWKELLHATGAVMAAQCSQETANVLGATEQNISAFKTGLGADISTPIAGSMDGADLYSSLAVLAAACNVNPVIFLKYPSNYVYKGLGLDAESHGISHRLGNASASGECLTDAIEKIALIDAFYAKKFAYLIAQLDGINEGDESLLDHTATVWFQEMSDGSAHNLNNLPIVQAGSAGGYFKTGWTINVEDGSDDLPNGNSEVHCATAEAATITNIYQQAAGTDPLRANAPINKYFCNLMNALGVKAGEDGFPAEGGQAEVTRFGMYDKTEDFIHGGTNPAMIHDPGEFSALRANA